jgi:hypothetical protein
MGAINYKTSDYITIGYNLKYVDYENKFYNDFISDYYDQVQYRLDQENFNAFIVKLEPGYYEGFSIDIKLDYLYFDDYIEKQEAQKEITRIKKFLLECINDFECTVIYPSWCTGYADYKQALKDLDDAIYEMREAVKNTPTYKQYKAG